MPDSERGPMLLLAALVKLPIGRFRSELFRSLLAASNLVAAQNHFQRRRFAWGEGDFVLRDVARFHADHLLELIVAEIGHVPGFFHPWTSNHR
jgi:hypothetical protein